MVLILSMQWKNLPLDYQRNSLEELTEKSNRIIESLENENNISNSAYSYQEILKLKNLSEKKCQKNCKYISEKTNNKTKEIIKKNEKWN